ASAQDDRSQKYSLLVNSVAKNGIFPQALKSCPDYEPIFETSSSSFTFSCRNLYDFFMPLWLSVEFWRVGIQPCCTPQFRFLNGYSLLAWQAPCWLLCWHLWEIYTCSWRKTKSSVRSL